MDRPDALRPRSAYYDGWPYALAIGRLSGVLVARIAQRIADGTRVLDAACGTGELALALGAKCAEVVGVDLSPRQIARAERARRRSGAGNVRFLVGDAARLDDFPDGHFASATMVMAVHEMPAAHRSTVLAELGRVAEEVLVVDFASPLPRSPGGLGLRFVELLAGPRHFSGFLSYQRSGGLAPVAQAAGLTVVERKVWGGTLDALSLRA